MNKLVTIVLLALAVCFFSWGASAQLASVSYGYPVIAQSNNAVSYEQDTANALNYQNVDISFPAGLAFSPGVSMAFPDISQTSLQTQSATQTDFSQSNSYAEFSYPFVSTGTTVLPDFSL